MTAAIVLILCILFALLWAASNLIAVIGGAQLVGTPRATVVSIVKIANLSPSETFLELGSGLGFVSRAVARTSHATVIGIDISPLWVLIARLLATGTGATFRIGSVYAADLRSVDMAYCYLLPPMLARLEPKFAEELRPGSRVITYGFPLPNRKPTRTIGQTDTHGPLFLYTY